jgi:FAD synthase
VGEGFRFGYEAAGDTAALHMLGQQYGMKVSVVQLVESGSARGAVKVHVFPCIQHFLRP